MGRDALLCLCSCFLRGLGLCDISAISRWLPSKRPQNIHEVQSLQKALQSADGKICHAVLPAPASLLKAKKNTVGGGFKFAGLIGWMFFVCLLQTFPAVGTDNLRYRWANQFSWNSDNHRSP